MSQIENNVKFMLHALICRKINSKSETFLKKSQTSWTFYFICVRHIGKEIPTFTWNTCNKNLTLKNDYLWPYDLFEFWFGSTYIIIKFLGSASRSPLHRRAVNLKFVPICVTHSMCQIKRKVLKRTGLPNFHRKWLNFARIVQWR